MFTFLVDSGDRVLLSCIDNPFLLGNSSFGCGALASFFGCFSVSAEENNIKTLL